MGATRRNLRSTQNPKEIIETPNQQIRMKIFPKKNFVSYLKSAKEPKICMRATRRNSQAQPKILKKYRNIKSTNQNKKFLKKKGSLVS
jgi:hypothetical protein